MLLLNLNNWVYGGRIQIRNIYITIYNHIILMCPVFERFSKIFNFVFC